MALSCRLLPIFVVGSVLSGLVAGEASGRPKPVQAQNGSIFKAEQFTSLGILQVGSRQELKIDTGGAVRAPTMQGVITATGALGRSQSGQVELAVFSFDAIDIAADAVVTVMGERGLVLCAKDRIVVAATIDLSGTAGKKMANSSIQDVRAIAKEDLSIDLPKDDQEVWKNHKETMQQCWKIHAQRQAGQGGPGGEGGVEKKDFASAPPPADGGNGSPGAKDNGFSGRGHGAGFNRRVKGGAGGGGGGYGGAGGASSLASNGGNNGKERKPMPGGVAYGDEELADLFGGSGGAGGSNDRQRESAAGGGGGGALALIAGKTLELQSTTRLFARGGDGGAWNMCGGGGSGGAILLAAPTLIIDAKAIIDVSGGAGGDNPDTKAEIATGNGRLNKGSGGGGGGGRVAFYSGKVMPEPQPAVKLAGGMGGSEATAGQAGSFYAGSW